jgi:PAS domain S-box-containing protein
VENNLTRFGLPAMLWAILAWVAWSRQRATSLPRERTLFVGFLLGFLREAFMFAHVSMRLITGSPPEHPMVAGLEPLEHALSMAAVVAVAGAYLHYLLRARRLSRRYLLVGGSVNVVSYLVIMPWWRSYILRYPGTPFHQTWAAWVFHVAASLLIVAAISLLWRRRNWLRNVVILALSCYFLGEAIMLVNFATDKSYARHICPIGNTFHILAIPLLGYVYLREQSIEKRLAEAELAAYQDHLEDLVHARTEELSAANRRLRQEVHDREETELALARLSQHHSLILHSAGEGIFGVDVGGRHTFVNRAAADMLGYDPAELIGEASHPIWHHSYPDGSAYPESACPLHAGYKSGDVIQGADQVFWRKDGTGFPVRYISTPIFEDGELRGAVVIFQDISDQKAAEAEIQRRNAELAVQNAIAATISQSLHLRTILDTALETVLRELGTQAGCVLLTDEAAGELHLTAQRGDDAGGEHRCPQAGCRLIAQRTVEEMAPVVEAIGRPKDLGGSLCLAVDSPHLLVGIPLVSKNRAEGAMILASRNGDGPLAERGELGLDLLASIGQQIGVAVENARLYEQAERAAALEERQRIAGDMHDGLAQTLSYVGHQVDSLIEAVDAGRSEEALALGDRIREVVDRASREVRQLIRSLHAKVRPRQSLQALLQNAMESAPNEGGLPIAFRSDLAEPVFVAPERTEQIVRVVQEAILNALRHADAEAVKVSLRAEDGDLVVTVEDNGRGFDPERPCGDGHDHFGLSIMRARAARLSGVLVIDASPGAGTRVELRWPVAAAPAEGPVR